MKKKLLLMLAVLASIQVLSGCGKTVSDESATDTSKEDSSTASTTEDSDKDSAKENKKLKKKMQSWLDEPENQMVLLDTFSSTDDINWPFIIQEAAKRDFIGTRLTESSSAMQQEYLQLRTRDELNDGDCFITDEEISSYTLAKVGKSCELNPGDSADSNSVWYRPDGKDYWYCNSYYPNAIHYQYYPIPEYEFECIDAEENGDEIILHAKSYTYTNAHEVMTEIHLQKTEDDYIVLSNEFQWSEGAVDLIPADLSMIEGEVTFALYDDRRIVDKDSELPTGEYRYSIALIQDNQVIDWIYLEDDYDDSFEKVTEINEIAAIDYNMDGISDLAITGRSEDGYYVQLLNWQEGYNGNGFFSSDWNLSRYVVENLDEPTADDILDYFTGGCSETGYSDYKQAYYFTALNYFASAGSSLGVHGATFDLIYFNDDDTPELVAGVDGYYVSVYQFIDGYVYPIIDSWPYGAGGNAGYEYYPRSGVIENFDQDGAGAEFYETYWKLNEDTHSMESGLYYHGINDTEHVEGEPGYYKYEGEESVEITESEYNSLLAEYLGNSEGNPSYLAGNLSLSEFQIALDDNNFGYTDYRDAFYYEVLRYFQENGDAARYALVYVTDEDTPNLLAEVPGEKFSLFRFQGSSSVALTKDQPYDLFEGNLPNYIPGENFLSYTQSDEATGTAETNYYMFDISDRLLRLKLTKTETKDSNGEINCTYKRDTAWSGDPTITEITEEEFNKYLNLYSDSKTAFEVLGTDSSMDEVLAKLQH